MLHKTFITPLDRDEIHKLITTMDDILDLMEDVAETISLYDVTNLTEEALRLAAICVQCCDQVKIAVGLLEDMGNASTILKTAQQIDQYLVAHPFFEGLDDPAIALVTGCAVDLHLHPGGYLFREGESADSLYVVRHGRVAIQAHQPTGAGLLDTARDGDVVGWSWVAPPYRWTFDAVATEETSVVALDAACLRVKCERDPALGYALLQRVVMVMSERLLSARVRLLDLYGSGP